ncbi:antigen 5 like allergen Cul n 1-like [Drosophila subobscura]|uniref:antigen 5 like allergen Cul n 1-like n=1 Tax=Drosophila subobscura TaxID=7241 RepID=UPI00155ACBBB|nr:antigen 5 like allergen Cul n 1-like [Drosophila subobscura]
MAVDRLLHLWLCIWLCLHLRCCLCEPKEFDFCAQGACSEGTGPHLACKHSRTFDSAACPAGAQLLRIDNSLARYIVREHNVARNQVARGTFHKLPAAQRMLTVHWDERLTWLAELSVMKCLLQRHSCLRSPSYQMPGQNEAYNKFRGDQDPLKILRSQLRAWQDEYIYVDLTTILGGNNLTKQDVGHYLQMITASVEGIGCAMAQYKKDQWTYHLTKCIYSCYHDCLPIYPTGHLPGELCRFGIHHAYQALCSAKERLMCDESDCCDLMDPKSAPVEAAHDNQSIAARYRNFAMRGKPLGRSRKAAYKEVLQKRTKVGQKTRKRTAKH